VIRCYHSGLPTIAANGFNIFSRINDIKMKQLVLSIVTAALLLFSGCATPLKVETNGEDLARVIGASPSEISFVSYCSFGEPLPSSIHVKFIEGVILLTHDSIVLLSGNPPKVAVKQRIRFAELMGVDLKHFGRGRQLQVLKGSTVTVMEISASKSMIDHGGSERAQQILREHGVPEWKSNKYYLRLVETPIFIPIIKQ
jgi:hypothetical protein